MKKLFIIANWKSHKTQDEASTWLQELRIRNQELSDKKIVVCPTFTLLSGMKAIIESSKLPIQLGAEDISSFDEGAYTGEVNGKQLMELCSYVIVGHSERRKSFGDTDEIVMHKIKKALESDLTPILCVSELSQLDLVKEAIGEKEIIVAFEPLAAIGSGEADSPEHAEDVAKKIKDTIKCSAVLYGGSVTAGNVHAFLAQENIDGVLVGNASLDAREFAAIIQHA